MGSEGGKRTGIRHESGRYARLAGSWIRRAWQEAPPRVTASSRALVATIAGELRGRRRRVVVRRWVGGALAASTVAMTLFAGVGRDGRNASVPSNGLVLLGGTGTTVTPGMRLLAPQADPLRLASSDGTELTVEPGGSLTVSESGATRRFALMRGSVLAHVKKLSLGERFIVDTADAEVEVHGTIFRVSVMAEPPACGPATTTRVSVAEGVVSVSGSAGRVILSPGDEWPGACSSSARSNGDGDEGADDASPARRRSVTRRALATPRVASATLPETRPASPPETTFDAGALEAQNDLFSAAIRAKRRGDAVGALALFERFIRRYPDASLVEGAFVQRMRLLAAADAQSGARAATQYLVRFPDGFARDEAQRIVGGAAAQ